MKQNGWQCFLIPGWRGTTGAAKSPGEDAASLLPAVCLPSHLMFSRSAPTCCCAQSSWRPGKQKPGSAGSEPPARERQGGEACARDIRGHPNDAERDPASGEGPQASCPLLTFLPGSSPHLASHSAPGRLPTSRHGGHGPPRAVEGIRGTSSCEGRWPRILGMTPAPATPLSPAQQAREYSQGAVQG